MERSRMKIRWSVERGAGVEENDGVGEERERSGVRAESAAHSRSKLTFH